MKNTNSFQFDLLFLTLQIFSCAHYSKLDNFVNVHTYSIVLRVFLKTHNFAPIKTENA